MLFGFTFIETVSEVPKQPLMEGVIITFVDWFVFWIFVKVISNGGEEEIPFWKDVPVILVVLFLIQLKAVPLTLLGAGLNVIVVNPPLHIGLMKLEIVIVGVGFNVTVVVIPTITVSGFAPLTGAIGSTVVITGNNFTGATAVLFNGIFCSTFTVNSISQITAIVPLGATTGLVTVQRGICSGVSLGTYTVATNVTLNLNMFIQGYYIGSGLMKPVLLNSGIKNTASIKINFTGSFPNPSHGITCIPVVTPDNTAISISLKNVLGQIVIPVFNGINNGEKKYFMNTSSTAPGVYLLEMLTKESRYSQMIIVR